MARQPNGDVARFGAICPDRRDDALRRFTGLVFVLLPGVAASQPARPDGEWITVNKDYSSQRYVDLDQITPANVGGSGRIDFSKRASGWITAMDGETGKVLWQYQTDGQQYVAAAAGGLSLNANGVAGPLRVVVYGLNGSDTLKVVTLERGPLSPLPVPGEAGNAVAFGYFCGGCHSTSGRQGAVGPPLTRQTQMGDPENLKTFLKSVPPPMPILYPGLLEDKDVEMIAAYLKTLAASTNAELPTNAQMPTSAYVQPTSGGSAEWQAVYSVFTSPRCINCHSMTSFPRQTDMRYPHIFGIVRGLDDKGVPLARCSACHSAANNLATGVPGAPNWHAAPLSMTMESAPGVAKTGAQLCATIKDRNRNGNRGLAELLEHVDIDPLILWAWQPGARWNGEARTTPPISHEEFIAAFKTWAEAGAPCPAE